MIRELHHGDYSARLEPMHIQEFLTKLFDKWSNIVLDLAAMIREPLMLDPFLLKIYFQNAVSNAMKYGKRGGGVVLTVTFQLGQLTVLCRNEPGPGHDKLIGLTETQVSEIFQKATRLDLGESDAHRESSFGDGGWLMQTCALAMNGECSIRFSEDHTDLTLVCPTSVSITHAQARQFEIPEGTYIVILDDSELPS